MTKQQIIDSLWNASNGLVMGWQMANVKDDAVRAQVQAPITSGQDDLLNVIRFLEKEWGLEA